MILPPTVPTASREEKATIKISRAGKIENGFSLLELLLVLSLLGLVSLVVLPSIDKGLNKLEVRRSALELSAVARDLRSKAIQESRFRRLIVDPLENSYETLQGEKIRLPSGIKISMIEGGEPLEDEKRQFIFFPNGRILEGKIGVMGREGTAAYTISLDPLSGRISIGKDNSS